MIKSLTKLISATVIVTMMTNCSIGRPSPKDFAFNILIPFYKLIPLNRMNSNLEFTDLDKVNNSFKIGSIIDIPLKNLSKNKIIFPSDYGVRLFTYNDGQWNEINNLLQYVPDGNTQISPEGPDTPGIITIGFLPDLVDEGKPIELRVIVQGIVYDCENPTGEQAGAYVDITLQP